MSAGSYDPLGIGAGTTIAERYEIERKIGSGATSAIYKVRDRALNNQLCALKLIDPRLNENVQDAERFRNEVVITRQLTHPNIVRTYEFGKTATGQMFIVMEYVAGKSLHQIIYSPARNDFSWGDIVHILLGVAHGIAYAHDSGVLHRDLKPANILISANGDVKIADFGLARAKELQIQLTQAGECVGTPAYMAPEQVQGLVNDHRVDIYALGIVAYELATGRLPFEADGWYNLASQIISEPTPKNELQKSRVPIWYQNFITKATSKLPEDRYSTADEVVNIFANHLTDTAVIKTRKNLRLKQNTSPWNSFKTAVMDNIYRYTSMLFIFSIMMATLLVVFNYGADSTEEFTEQVDQSSQLISNFAEAMNKMNDVILKTYQNKDKIDAVVERLEQEETIILNPTVENPPPNEKKTDPNPSSNETKIANARQRSKIK